MTKTTKTTKTVRIELPGSTKASVRKTDSNSKKILPVPFFSRPTEGETRYVRPNSAKGKILAAVNENGTASLDDLLRIEREFLDEKYSSTDRSAKTYVGNRPAEAYERGSAERRFDLLRESGIGIVKVGTPDAPIFAAAEDRPIVDPETGAVTGTVPAAEVYAAILDGLETAGLLDAETRKLAENAPRSIRK